MEDYLLSFVFQYIEIVKHLLLHVYVYIYVCSNFYIYLSHWFSYHSWCPVGVCTVSFQNVNFVFVALSAQLLPGLWGSTSGWARLTCALSDRNLLNLKQQCLRGWTSGKCYVDRKWRQTMLFNAFIHPTG